MNEYIFNFLFENIELKNNSFVTLDELYDLLPRSKIIINYSKKDIQNAIQTSHYWDMMDICYRKSITCNNKYTYSSMSCNCNNKCLKDIFLGVVIKNIEDNHFIDCGCLYDCDY